jgi:hypothetical protein
MPLSVNMCVAKEFVTVESVDIINETVYGTDMIKNGSKVSIEVVLSNFSEEIGGYPELIFYSDLVPYPHVSGVSIDGIPKAYPFNLDPRTAKKVTVTLIGDAPEVNKRTEEPIILLNISQKIKEVYPVLEIKRYVSSETIEDAIVAINTAKTELEKAQMVVANATEAGVDVADAKTSFALANEHLNNSNSLYNEGRPQESLEEAELALDFAKAAEGKAEAAIGGKTKGNIALIAAVVVIAVVAVLVLTQKWRRKRKIY